MKKYSVELVGGVDADSVASEDVFPREPLWEPVLIPDAFDGMVERLKRIHHTEPPRIEGHKVTVQLRRPITMVAFNRVNLAVRLAETRVA